MRKVIWIKNELLGKLFQINEDLYQTQVNQLASQFFVGEP